MKKRILPVLLCISLLLSLSGCGKIVSREDYDKLATELADAKAEIELLKEKSLKEQENGLKILAYVASIDLLMYPFVPEGVPTRFQFENTEAWLEKLRNGAELLGDETLKDYLSKLEKGEVGVAEIVNYLLGKAIEQASS